MAIDKQGISTGKDVRRLVEDMENELLFNYRKQFIAKTDQRIEDVDWDAWKDGQMRKMNGFRKSNRSIINKYSKEINKEMVKDFEKSYRFGINLVGRQVRDANKQGARLRGKGSVPSFTKNKRILSEFEKTQKSLNQSYSTTMKSLENEYRKTINTAQNASPIAKSMFQAIDAANKDLMKFGITGKVSKNNRRINVANHIEMTTVETSQEMLFVGEATKSEDVGIYTVYITKHHSACPECTPWQGKVLIDDVYMPGKPDGKHELLSTAIKAGLFHVNCRCNRVTYIEGVDVMPESEKENLKGVSKRDQHALYKAEQEMRYNERMIREAKRAEGMALSLPEAEKARLKVREYQRRNRELVKNNEGLFRNYWREKPGFKVPDDVRWQNLKYDRHIFDDVNTVSTKTPITENLKWDFKGDIPEDVQQDFVKSLKGDEEYKLLINKYIKTVEFVDISNDGRTSDHYNYRDKTISMHWTNSKGVPTKRRIEIMRHELGHHIDRELSDGSGLSTFTMGDKNYNDAFSNDAKLYKGGGKFSVEGDFLGQTKREARLNISQLLKSDDLKDNHELSNFFSSLTANGIKGFAIHSNSYLATSGKKQQETFANLISIYSGGDKVAINILEKYAPNLTQEFKKNVSKAIK